MSIEIRRARDEDWAAICYTDTRAFGSVMSAEDMVQRRPLIDLDRFHIAIDDGSVVGVAGSFAFDVTLPGGSTVPMGGVTWVSVAATHRRRGVMRSVIGAVHDDIDERGEPLATLYASEGGIYEHVGYGVASQLRVVSIDRRQARIRPEFATPVGGVRYLDEGVDVADVIGKMWDRVRRCRTGEVSRSSVFHDMVADVRSKGVGGMSIGYHLVHQDGFACYRIQENWNNGHPAHTMHIVDFAAATPEAHLALWQTLLSVDLVAEITTRMVPIDDPLPYLLENQRVVRTTELNDGVWANLRDISICFGARTYRTTDRIVVEADGRRWAIDGGPDGGSCRVVRTKPDLVTSHSGLSSLLYGGVSPTSLVNGRRMTARSPEVLERADAFFTTGLAPYCTTSY